MSAPISPPPPQAYSRLCESLASRGEPPAVSPALGELTRALAASRPGGVFLCLGRGAGEMAAWIFDGMDLSGRLVVVLQSDQEADALRALLDDDMRITVHVQDAVTFLGDVRDHRFDLITELNPAQSADRSADLGRLALTRLAPGAFYLSLHGAGELADILAVEGGAGPGEEVSLNAESFSFAQLPDDLGVSLMVHGPHRVQAKRRGGRRSRQGVTPLFSSRPPRRR
jgi:hypothetical protein